MATADDIPGFHELMWPALEAIKKLGGSARIDELSEEVVKAEGFSEEQQQVTRRPDDRMSMIDYRLAWARNYLKNIGATENSARGVWSITEAGKTLQPEEIPDKIREYKRAYYRKRKAQKALADTDGDIDDAGQEDEADDWKDQLLTRLGDISPEAFERLAQRVLREAGFNNVEVTGGTGDQGIDGVGIYRVSLVSFPVYFQCKRHKSSVGSKEVRDFRGAMAGRGDRGLLITTASFTPAAREEASRDGAPPVDLINGDGFCDLLKEYGLGVNTETVEVYSIESAFFDQFEDDSPDQSS